MSRALFLTVFAALITACAVQRPAKPIEKDSPTATQTPSKLHFDAAGLIGKPTAEIDRVLGKPSKTTLADEPENMPGEWRDYVLPGALSNFTPKGLVVKIHRGKAVGFDIDLSQSYSSERDALKAVGIDLNYSSYPPPSRSQMAATWNNIVYQGVLFTKISALEMGDSKGFNAIQLSVE